MPFPLRSAGAASALPGRPDGREARRRPAVFPGLGQLVAGHLDRPVRADVRRVRRRRHRDDQQARPSIGHGGSSPEVVNVPNRVRLTSALDLAPRPEGVAHTS
jgi:hypothetical protein